MPAPEQLELIAHGATAILATWLGLTVAVRAPRQPGARVFTFLTVLLVTWSVSIVVQRLTGDPAAIKRPLHAIEVGSAFLLPAATLHIAVALTVESRRGPLLQAAIAAFYALSWGVGLLSAIDPGLEPRVAPAPHLELPGLPGEVVGWAWIILRLVIFGAALAWIARAIAASGPDLARRRQLQVIFATILVGALGATARIVPPISDSDPWLGVSLITLAVVLASYAVFAQGVFFSPEVANRAFRYSVVVGLAVTAYVGGLVIVDRAARDLLAIELPLVTTLALVVTIALFDPISARVRGWITGSADRDLGYARLLRALGQSVLTAQRPETAIDPALARLSRTFRLTGAEARNPGGELIASHGIVPDSPLTSVMPLRTAETDYGTVAFGPKRSQLPFTPHERELLTLAAGYLAASLRLGERHEEQAEALDVLSAETAAVATSGTALHQALTGDAPSTALGLHVFALGPLRVQRGGELVRQWGGEKAGTRQAEALFAFLFDRGERGVAKDEAVELIWPDVDLDRADLAFHRTLGGLRRTLEPDRGRRDGGGPIAFHNDRYRLDPSIVTWSDVDAFVERLATASAATDPDDALRALNEARSLYRGDYLDDCPFYGDSAQVEDRRELLRGRYVDLLLALGERYEARDDRAAAAAAFREARMASGDECPPAEAGLARLGVSSGPAVRFARADPGGAR